MKAESTHRSGLHVVPVCPVQVVCSLWISSDMNDFFEPYRMTVLTGASYVHFTFGLYRDQTQTMPQILKMQSAYTTHLAQSTAA